MSDPNEKITRGHWMALSAALLGWLFDGAEMGVFSLVGRPALRDLLATDDDGKVGFWFGAVLALFLVGAATGGVLFGWLGDRIGRVRAMTLSVLTYAIFTGLCGFATSAEQIGALRFIASLGMGGEWALGVALVMEIWPNRSRALLAGLIGAAANVGYLMVALLGLGLAEILADVKVSFAAWGMSESWITHLTKNQGWRLLMISGTAPALLTFLIRLFVPESNRWEAENKRGTTSNWVTRDLLGVLVGAVGALGIVYLWANESLPLVVQIVGTLIGLAIATVGYMYPVAQFVRRTEGSVKGKAAVRFTLRRMLLAAGLSGIALLGTWASVQWAPTWADKIAGDVPSARGWTLFWQALGASIGCVVAALMGDWLGRRVTYGILCLVSLGSILLLYQGNTVYGPQLLACVFVAGFCTAAFYGWLPLYLPELFATRVRATGQGFGFNYGRILAAVGTLITGNLMRGFSENDYAKACSIMSSVYLLGLVLILFAPETKGKPLPD
jgi:MFS transporter, SHS family, sialic acid transporter